MNIISPQTSCSSISSDTITLTSSTGSYMLGSGINSSSSTITISGSGSSGSTFIGGVGAGISASEFIWKSPEEFVDAWPEYERVQRMCEQYPGLKIAYEKFVTTYRLVKDDYDTPKDQR